jgi:hypothetical protein
MPSVPSSQRGQPDQLEQQARARVWAARRRGWLSGLAVLAAWFVLRGGILPVLEPGTLTDLLHGVVDVLPVAGIAVGIRAYARALPSCGMVVWLRRFRSDRSRTLGRLLDRACHGIAQPLTMQDSSYSWSVSQSTVRAGLMVPVVMLVWVAVAIPLAGLVSAVNPDPVILVLVEAGWTLWLAWEIADQAKVRGFRTVSVQQARAALAGAQLPGTRRRMGIEVLRVPDAGWRDLVRASLDQAVAAIVDVTDANDIIREELVLALSILGRDRIVLGVERGPQADPERIWSEVVAPVQDAGALRPTPAWVRSAVFEYSPRARGKEFRNDAARLRRLLFANANWPTSSTSSSSA